ncbi:TPA: TrbM/KikA/MpfK family conjugal transfer protein [Pseudomonas aeruginosa]|uniref:TrbM/KikA/MpfK family conjugal transfer protein n=1 Tax=Pseudomonas aeruginosa TaxID=287 RepID=UPI000E32D7D3|nr:TrbM/KikA/MpfK family conjugal transfer protein [Pseudomonas aeruginosa]MDP2556110.1 TrbM/KikA/MpfK family conjugal transfer protein [Pseudomonas aeruginosa]SYY08084.1 conjugal transfer protein TrbM [Acinetobacter baumannii]
MKRLLVASSLAAMMFGAMPAAQAEELFTGDTRLACEAILCLSTGQRPGECAPSLSRYFGIHKRKLSDTIKARKNFLNLCPSASADVNMRSLVDAISNGAGRCDAAALNSSLMVWNYNWYDDREQRYYIRNTLPGHCSAYGGNAYTDQTNIVTAKYVGTPERGGFWVNPADYDKALAEYNARIAAEDASGGPRNTSWGGNR